MIREDQLLKLLAQVIEQLININTSIEAIANRIEDLRN